MPAGYYLFHLTRPTDRRRVRAFLAALLLAALVPFIAGAQSADRPPRILVVYSDTSTLTANLRIATGLSEVLEKALSPRHELYTEFRAIQQFPEEAQDQAFVEMLVRKYAATPVDVIVAVGPAAYTLVMAHRDQFAPGAPVVAGAITQRSIGDALPPDTHVAITSFDVGETVALAKGMQPDARRLVVFTGSSEFDRNWQRTAQEALAEEQGLEVEYVSGLTLSEFETAAAALGADTILLILTIFEDAAGARFIPAEAAGLIAARSGAPSWGVYSTFIENGVVGGVVESFEDVGRTVGGLAVDAIAGSLGEGTVISVPHASVLDWAQLRRFGLDPALRPLDAVLLNYTPSVWERYRTTIVAVAAVVLAQSATIAALIVQGRRRQVAQREAAEHRLEVARLSRVSQLGALSGAITHELNQPLSAILANAEAGTRLLRKSPPDLEEVGEILADIAEDDRRAAKIISDLRTLMYRKSIDLRPVDLNDVAKAVTALIQSEALLRDVQILFRPAPQPLLVLGDTEQLKQILLNLILNGMDAMTEASSDKRVLTIETAERPDGWRMIAVEDTGPGLAGAAAKDPFRPFVTTKANGLGMGLAICRTIAEAHNGTIAFAPCDHGARVVLALPPR
ncbi:sensor histidine kinase [Palleronia sp. KMU-117]|uniref:sensor histidine kinase n=1 Tax=Palleronia sp. KMU-117 TaxID=3434108 RepID=UPI003D734C58